MNTPISRRIRLAICCFLAALPLAVAAPGLAADYTFKTIVDSTGDVTFDTFASGYRRINDSGEVAFQGTEEFQHFIFKGSGGPLTPIAGPPGFFGLNFGTGSIDDAGRVVFRGSPQSFVEGIYRGSGGGVSELALSDDITGAEDPSRLFYAPSTSPSGIVAFHGRRYDFPDQEPDEFNDGYYLVTGPGSIATLAEDGGTYSSSGSTAPVINDAGQVAFQMTVASSRHILRYDNGSLTTVATGFTGGDEIWMNSAGDVIFADALSVKLYSGGVTTTVASPADGFSSLMKPGDADVFINDSGDVAFWGAVETFNGNPVTWQGIYTGPDIVNDRVLVHGDSLLGHVASTVEILGLNNAGQIAFSVFAQSPDPWRAIVVATPVREADFDEDGDVDGDDLVRWRNNFGAGTTHMTGDADGDGDADGSDFLVWQRQSGSSSGVAATATVPEPSALTLVLLLAAFSFLLPSPHRGRGAGGEGRTRSQR